MIGSSVNPALGRIDYSPITQGAQSAAQSIQAGGQAYGNMFANLGQQIGSGIQQYQKNKQEREFLVSTIGGRLSEVNQAVSNFIAKPKLYNDESPINQDFIKKIKVGNIANMSTAQLKALNNQLGEEVDKSRSALAKANAMRQAERDMDMENATEYASGLIQGNGKISGETLKKYSPNAVVQGRNIYLNQVALEKRIEKENADIERARAEVAGMGLPRPLSAADQLAREKFELEKIAMGQPKPPSLADELARERFEREKALAAAAEKKDIEKEKGQADYFRQKTVNTVSNINRLISLYESGTGGGVSGIKAVGQALSFIPFNSGQAAIANTLLDSIKATLSLDEINRMKSFSKTGATGFGSLSDKEGAKIESNITTLDPTLPREEIVKRLKQVKNSLMTFGTPAEPLVINKVTEIK
jgi:hypothetical protein